MYKIYLMALQDCPDCCCYTACCVLPPVASVARAARPASSTLSSEPSRAQEHTHLAPAFVWLSSKQWRHCKPGNFPVSQYRQTSHSPPPPCKHRDGAHSPDVAVWRAGGAAAREHDEQWMRDLPATSHHNKQEELLLIFTNICFFRDLGTVTVKLTSEQRESGAVAVTVL